MNEPKKRSDNDFALPAILALGVSPFRAGRRRVVSVCALCHKAIEPAQGYRTVTGVGTVHGSCVEEKEGTDAKPRQQEPAGGSDGVCPEG